MKKSLPLIVCTLPAIALANAGVGFFFLPQPLLLITLGPVILLEAWVIWFWLKHIHALSVRQALLYSLQMNLVSTLAGAALALLLDLSLLGSSSGFEQTKTITSIMLLVFLYWSWRIEYRVLRKKSLDIARRTLLITVLLANLSSYMLLISAVWLSPQFLAHESLAPRILISNVLMSIKATLSSADLERAKPPSSAELLELPAIQALIQQPQRDFQWLDLSPDLRLRLRLHAPKYRAIDGKILLIDFRYEGKPYLYKLVNFHCQAPGVDPRVLPMECR